MKRDLDIKDIANTNGFTETLLSIILAERDALRKE